MSFGHPVVVVGAGLAGLACAVRLQRQGNPVVVVEAADAVGGRVRSDVVEGFTIDRGFQVLNTGYPAVRSTVNLSDLDLRHLPRGARIRRNGRIHLVPHPLASISAPVKALTSGVVGLGGKVALARYAGSLLASSPASIKARPDTSALQAWADLPDAVVDGVLQPFLSGVVLEPEMRTSRVFTDLMMRMFATGSSAVPSRGMQQLPATLAARLPSAAVRLNSPVAAVDAKSVTLADGSAIGARAVVVAADPWTAHLLVPGLGEPPRPLGVTTYYFAARPWAGIDGTLTVDADSSSIVNSVVLTESAPEYSRDGRALIATSVLHTTDQPGTEVIRRQAAELHDAPDDDWELIATRDIPAALPAMPAPHTLRKPSFEANAGTWVAGDHRDTSSIQGALVSGNRAAAAVVRHLDQQLVR